MNRTRTMEGAVSKEQSHGEKKLAYSVEFKELISETPGVISSVRALMRQAVETYSPPDIILGTSRYQSRLRWSIAESCWYVIENKLGAINPPQDLRTRPFGEGTRRGCVFKPHYWLYDIRKKLGVQLLGIGNCTWHAKDKTGKEIVVRDDKTTYFKVILDGHAFFVKRSTASNNPGFSEFTHTRLVADTLEDVPNLRCITPLLGYQDAHQSWFVSEWEEISSAGYITVGHIDGSGSNDYGEQVGDLWMYYHEELTAIQEEDMQRSIDARRDTMETIVTLLHGIGLEIYDLYNNLFYSRATGEFLLLDISIKGTPPLGYVVPEP